MKFARLPQALMQVRARTVAWGWPGLLGLVCVVAAALVKLAWLPALQRESEALATEADAVELRVVRSRAQRKSIDRPEPTSQQFRSGFPLARARQERVAVLLDLAAAHGLASKGTEFRLSKERDTGLLRYSLSMPLVGSYANLRAFIEEAQARDPALALDRLRLRRASAAASSVDVELGWSMYMQADVPPVVAARQSESALR